jgi:hypothetical protein
VDKALGRRGGSGTLSRHRCWIRAPEALVPDPSPRASRLATPSWLDLRLVTGVVMVLLSVVIGARIFASADRYTQVYVARSSLVPGEHVAADDLRVGQARFDGEGAEYVAAGAEPVGYVVTRYVGAGELVPIDSLAPHATAAAASRLVTVPVDAGHRPTDLAHGDLVDVYVTAKSGLGHAPAPPTRVLAGVPVDSADDGGDSLTGDGDSAVVLAVPTEDVDAMVAAVESGSIDLVRIPAADVAVAPSPAP